MNTKLHAVADAKGRPIGFCMSAGQVSDYTGAAALLGSLPKAGWLLADRGYDADWFREALKDKGIKVCIPGRKSRKKAVKYDKRRYKRRNRIEIMFGRLKDWRRVATRYDRCPETFFSAIMLAATVLFRLSKAMSLGPGRLAVLPGPRHPVPSARRALHDRHDHHPDRRLGLAWPCARACAAAQRADPAGEPHLREP